MNQRLPKKKALAFIMYSFNCIENEQLRKKLKIYQSLNFILKD